jgi:hypothetical protein
MDDETERISKRKVHNNGDGRQSTTGGSGVCWGVGMRFLLCRRRRQVSHVRCSMGFQRRLQQVQTWTRTGPGRSDMVGGGMIWRYEETLPKIFECVEGKKHGRERSVAEQSRKHRRERSITEQSSQLSGPDCEGGHRSRIEAIYNV